MPKANLSTPLEIRRFRASADTLGIRSLTGSTPYTEHIFLSSEMGERWVKTETLGTKEEKRKYLCIFSEPMPHEADFTVRLAAQGTRVDVIAIFLGKNTARVRFGITVHHEAPDTFARVLFKAALRDASRVDFLGMLNIHKGADGSDSYLKAQALMLSEKAIARIDPQLEILAHNVKASHGATIGRMGAQELFYLQSRGLMRQQAERVLIQGFFADAFASMPPTLAASFRNQL